MRSSLPLVIVALGLVSTAPVRAEPSLGIGLAQGLDGTSGVTARYAGPVDVALTLGGGRYRIESQPDTRADIHLGARLMVPLQRADVGWIGVVVGAVGHVYTTRLYDSFGVSGEVGVHAEWYVAPALSLGLEAGAALTYVSDYATLPDGTYTTGGINSDVGRRGAAGAASVTYWLDAVDDRPEPPPGVRLGMGATRSVHGGGFALAIDAGRLRGELLGTREEATSIGADTLNMVFLGGALFEVARRGPVALSLGARVGGTVVVESYWDLGLIAELPVRLELDAFRWLSVHAEGGIAFTGSRDTLDTLSAVDLTAPGVAGAVGFTAWL